MARDLATSSSASPESTRAARQSAAQTVHPEQSVNSSCDTFEEPASTERCQELMNKTPERATGIRRRPHEQCQRIAESHERLLLVRALAKVFMHLAELGQCRLPLASAFHAVRPPRLDIGEYLARISYYYLCSDACLVLALVYIDRLMKLHPEFVVSPLSIHRLIAVSMTVAAKFADDDFFANSYYSRVVGVRVQELNALEAQFLHLLQWQLFVTPEEFRSYMSHLDNVLDAIQVSRSDTAVALPEEPQTALQPTPPCPATRPQQESAAGKMPHRVIQKVSPVTKDVDSCESQLAKVLTTPRPQPSAWCMKPAM